MSRLPFELSIPKPCTQQWENMTGTASHRHCDSCNQQVHNLATLTPKQIERLVYKANGHLCGRITRRADGSMVTADEQRRAPRIAAGLALISGLSASPLSAQVDTHRQAEVSGKVLVPPGQTQEHPFLVSFSQSGELKGSALTDDAGSWRSELPPGDYDVKISGLLNHAQLEIQNVTLHAGSQEFGAMQTHPPEDVTVTEGGIVDNRSFARRVAYHVAHPLLWLRNFR